MSRHCAVTFVVCVALALNLSACAFAQCSGRGGSGSNASSSGYQQVPLASRGNSAYGQFPSRQSGYPAFAGNSNYNQNALAQAYRNQQALQSRTVAIQNQRLLATARNEQLRALRAQRRTEKATENTNQESNSGSNKLVSTGT